MRQKPLHERNAVDRTMSKSKSLAALLLVEIQVRK